MEKPCLSSTPSGYSRARCSGGGSDESLAGTMREKHCESLPPSSISAPFGRTAFDRADSSSWPADPDATASSDEGLITAGFAGRRRVPGDGVVPEEGAVVRRRRSPRLMGQLTRRRLVSMASNKTKRPRFDKPRILKLSGHRSERLNRKRKKTCSLNDRFQKNYIFY